MYELKKRGMYDENDANEILVNNFACDLFLIYTYVMIGTLIDLFTSVKIQRMAELLGLDFRFTYPVTLECDGTVDANAIGHRRY